jgi:hypothetical protein
MTTDDFAQYDFIYFDGDCSVATDYSAAVANQDVWAAAITGRRMISVADPNAHFGAANTQRVVQNTVTWAGALGNSASGGQTGLVFYTGCNEFAGSDVMGLFPSLGAFTTVFENVEASSLLAPGHPIATTPNTLASSDFVWGEFCHGSFSAVPAGYTSIVNCTSGNLGMVALDAPVPRVLAYSPGGTATIPLIEAEGFVVDQADALLWASLTADDFAQYNFLYFGGAWPGPGVTAYDPVRANEAVWGSVVTGRILASTTDPDFHFAEAGPTRVIQNYANWAGGLGATATGGRTGLVLFHGGDNMTAGPYLLESLSATLGAITLDVADESEGSTLLDETHLFTLVPNDLAPADFIWGNFCHGTMTTFPAGYLPMVGCTSGAAGLIIGEFGTCGDGTLSIGEDCDGPGETATCDPDCSDSVCGDGTVNTTAGETCDDSGESATCDTDCTAAVCGDGLTNTTAGETCDDAGESATCDTDCTAAACGDGVINTTAGETCDDSGESATCDTDCTAAACGDGVPNTTAGETCDDAGDSATCDADCTSATCGDDTLNGTAGEACDDGTDNSDTEADACRTDCQAASCGDGVTDTGEDCDDGTDNGPAGTCATDCTVNPGMPDAGPDDTDGGETGEPDAGGGGEDSGGGCCAVVGNRRGPDPGSLFLIGFVGICLRRGFRRRRGKSRQ